GEPPSAQAVPPGEARRRCPQNQIRSECEQKSISKPLPRALRCERALWSKYLCRRARATKGGPRRTCRALPSWTLRGSRSTSLLQPIAEGARTSGQTGIGPEIQFLLRLSSQD